MLPVLPFRLWASQYPLVTLAGQPGFLQNFITCPIMPGQGLGYHHKGASAILEPRTSSDTFGSNRTLSIGHHKRAGLSGSFHFITYPIEFIKLGSDGSDGSLFPYLFPGGNKKTKIS